MELVAVLQRHAGDQVVADQEALDAGAGPDLAAGGLEGGTHGAADRTHAAAGEAPGADRPVHVAHIVVQEHVGGAGRVDAEARCR